MTDYIAWILDELPEEDILADEEAVPETLEAGRLLWPRRQGNRLLETLGISRRNRRREQALELGSGRDTAWEKSPDGGWSAKRNADLDLGGMGENKPSRETEEEHAEEHDPDSEVWLPLEEGKAGVRRMRSLTQAARRQGAAAMAQAEGQATPEVEALYQKLLRASRVADFSPIHREERTAEPLENPGASWGAVSLLELDRNFQRDARRYDSGFSLL